MHKHIPRAHPFGENVHLLPNGTSKNLQKQQLGRTPFRGGGPTNFLQIRRDFTRGRYTIDFTGDPRALAGALEPLISEFSFTDAPRGRQRMELLLKPDATLREAIAVSNDAAEIAAVNEAMASMNDIFINAVKSSNK